jgi:hypothetical protein
MADFEAGSGAEKHSTSLPEVFNSASAGEGLRRKYTTFLSEYHRRVCSEKDSSMVKIEHSI